MFIKSGYIVAHTKIRAIAAATITKYEINIAIFVLLYIGDLYVVKSVIRKNGATYALV